MKNLSTLILAFFVCFTSYAQITTDEQPISFNPAVGLVLKDNASDVKTLPGLDMSQLEQEDKKDEANGLPPRFGFPHKVNFNLRNSGVWTVLPNGDRIWQLSIRCPDALSINLLYDLFWLPEGAKLFVYTNDRHHVIGAMTSRNNKGTKKEIQGYATGLLYGDAITLEYYLPDGINEQGIVSISNVVQGYRYIASNGNVVSRSEYSGIKQNFWGVIMHKSWLA